MRGCDLDLFNPHEARELRVDIVEDRLEVLAEPGHLVHLPEPGLIADGVGDEVGHLKRWITTAFRHEIEISRDVLAVNLELHVAEVLFDQSIGAQIVLKDDDNRPEWHPFQNIYDAWLENFNHKPHERLTTGQDRPARARSS